jgi:hypothetical protein
MDQKSGVSGIPGGRIVARVGVVTIVGNAPIEARLADPEPARAEPLHVDPDSFLAEYYRPMLELLNEEEAFDENVGGRRYRIVAIDEADCEVGLDSGVIEAAREGRDLTARLAHVAPRPNEADAKATLGLDGGLIRVGRSWSESQMALEPAERSLNT